MTSTNERIFRQCESLQKKLSAISGEHRTDTRRRQTQQRLCDKKKERIRHKLELLQHFKDEAAYRELTPFENALLTSTFLDEIMLLLNQHQYYRNHPTHCVKPVRFDQVAEKHQKTLIGAGISNSEELCGALDLFEDMLQRAVMPTDPDTVKLRDMTFRARLRQEGDIQFTPEPLAERVVDLAGIKPGSKVLEPEAGIANIADAAKKITPDVDCIELDPDFRTLLTFKGHNIVAWDLFKYEQRPVYDAVLMNPPFSAEIEHIKYAFGFLKPGGTLVAVCSKRFNYIKTNGYPEFQLWLEQRGLYYENAGREFEMTGTATAIIKISKGSEEHMA